MNLESIVKNTLFATKRFVPFCILFLLSFQTAPGADSFGTTTDDSTLSKTNIVVLFADDAGYADFGFQPNVRSDLKNLTPNIDSIASDGARFSNAYMSGSVCSPSRAGLMTGRYQQRFGHDNNIPPGYMKGGLSLEETFGAKRLQRQGYKTGLIGKWHLGYPKEYQPNQRGFDWFYGCLQGSRSYFPMKKTTPHRVFLDNTTPTEETGYITDRIGDAACRFISEHKTDPFFLFVSFTAPHGPLQAKEDDLELLASIENPKRRKYAGLVKSMDDNVGKILKALNENDLDKNTLVIFTNDNGGQTLTGANNSPLRGRKGTLWEGGIRVPLAMRWPEKISAGRVIETPVISLDFFATFLSMSGESVPESWKLDGQDLTPLLTNKEAKLETRTLFWRRQGGSGTIAARRGKWKMIHERKNENAKPQLYDLSNDVEEKNDVADDHPKILTDLVGQAETWEKELSEPLWGPNRNNRKRNR